MIRKTLLPPEYQEVEYIESTGTQYIDTNISPTNNTRTEIKFFNNATGSWYIFGSRSQTTNVMLYAQTGSQTGSTIYPRVNGEGTAVGWARTATGAIYEVVLETKENVYDYSIKDLTNNRNYSVNNVSFTQFTTSMNIYLGAVNTNNIQAGTTRFYKFKIFQNDILARDMIPCYRKSDSIIGMYDLVTKTFFTNSGAGTFGKGSDIITKEVGFIYKTILPNEYQEVEYIESTGTQYIDTGVVQKIKPKIVTTLAVMSNNDLDLMGNDSAYSGCFIVDAYPSNTYLYYRYSTSSSSGISGFFPTSDTSFHSYEFGEDVYKDGTFVYRFPNHDFSVNTKSIYLFRGRTYALIKLKRTRIYDGDTLLRDYFPCYRKSDDEIGLYDIVNKVFYTNSGTGTFTKGNNVGASNIDKIYHGTDLVFEQGFTREDAGISPLKTTHQTIGKTLKDYKIYGNSVQKILPDEYQEVEWVAGDDSGNPMIVVGEVSSLNTVIKFNAKLKRINNGSGYPAFLSTLDYANTQLLINQHPQVGTEAFFYVTFGNITDKYDNIYNSCQPTQNFYDYELSKKGLSVKNYGAITFNATSFSTANICIIGKANNNSKSDAYFRSFKVYDGTTLIYDLKPCYRKADGVIGMYDVVTDRFLTNSRTGSLTKGENVPSPSASTPIRSVGDNIRGLPFGYQQVEYIESTGTQHIDTAFVPNQDTKIMLEIMPTETEYCRLYGAYSGSSWTSGSYGAYFNAYGNTFWVNYNSDTNIPDFGIQANVECKIYQDKNKFYVNDTLKYTLDTQNAFTPERTMYLMALNRDNESRKGKFKLYDCKIWDNDTLVRDYVPCYRKSDDTIGLYDLVYGIFHENAGTGVFLKGNDVNNYKIPVKAIGKNLFNKNNFEHYEAYVSGQGVITSSVGADTCIIMKVQPSTTYIVWSSENATNNNRLAQFTTKPLLNSTGTNVQVISQVPYSFTFTTASTTNYIAFHSGKKYGTTAQTNWVDGMQIEYGSSATTYEVYQEADASVYLDEPLRKVGNYADYIDYQSQKVYRNVIVNDDTGTLPIDQSYSGTTDTAGTSITLPDILSIQGTTTYEVDTEIQPSNMYIKYKGK